MTLASSIIPQHKCDDSALRHLHAASDTEVIAVLPELLEWLQDRNWPVARQIPTRLAKLDAALVAPITQILRGHDGFWKYSLLQCLFPLISIEVLRLLEPELRRLADEPTAEDHAEEVHIAAAELLAERA